MNVVDGPFFVIRVKPGDLWETHSRERHILLVLDTHEATNSQGPEVTVLTLTDAKMWNAGTVMCVTQEALETYGEKLKL